MNQPKYYLSLISQYLTKHIKQSNKSKLCIVVNNVSLCEIKIILNMLNTLFTHVNVMRTKRLHIIIEIFN